MAETPLSSNLSASSKIFISECLAQPSTETKPSLASIPTTILSGNSLQLSLTNSGFFIAAVPRITREMPLFIQCSTLFKSRMPPPNWIGHLTLSIIEPIASLLIERPANAPSKSTTCNHSHPAD